MKFESLEAFRKALKRLKEKREIVRRKNIRYELKEIGPGHKSLVVYSEEEEE